MWGNFGEELAGVREGIRELIEEKEEKNPRESAHVIFGQKEEKRG